MIEKQGDLFTTDTFYLGHGVNCQGVMGAGVAKIVRDRYPDAYRVYKSRCSRFALNPGQTQPVFSKGKIILNMATQLHPGPDAKYEWVLKCLVGASRYVLDHSIQYTHDPVIAIPQIGCGIGGLEWAKVLNLIETAEIVIPRVEYEVWSLS